VLCPAWDLFLLRRRSRWPWRWRRRRLSLHRLRFDALQNRGWAAAPGCVDRQCDGSDHKGHRRPGSGSRERVRGAARSKRRLTALPAKSRGNIPALAALQQDDHDNKKTNQNVNGSDEIDHNFEISPKPSVSVTSEVGFLCVLSVPWRLLRLALAVFLSQPIKILVRKGGFEPPRLSAPPPQDGVSASSTTSAL
jgi:hypothetical protein